MGSGPPAAEDDVGEVGDDCVEASIIFFWAWNKPGVVGVP